MCGFRGPATHCACTPEKAVLSDGLVNSSALRELLRGKGEMYGHAILAPSRRVSTESLLRPMEKCFWEKKSNGNAVEITLSLPCTCSVPARPLELSQLESSVARFYLLKHWFGVTDSSFCIGLQRPLRLRITRNCTSVEFLPSLPFDLCDLLLLQQHYRFFNNGNVIKKFDPRRSGAAV